LGQRLSVSCCFRQSVSYQLGLSVWVFNKPVCPPVWAVRRLAGFIASVSCPSVWVWAGLSVCQRVQLLTNVSCHWLSLGSLSTHRLGCLGWAGQFVRHWPPPPAGLPAVRCLSVNTGSGAGLGLGWLLSGFARLAQQAGLGFKAATVRLLAARWVPPGPMGCPSVTVCLSVWVQLLSWAGPAGPSAWAVRLGWGCPGLLGSAACCLGLGLPGVHNVHTWAGLSTGFANHNWAVHNWVHNCWVPVVWANWVTICHTTTTLTNWAVTGSTWAGLGCHWAGLSVCLPGWVWAGLSVCPSSACLGWVFVWVRPSFCLSVCCLGLSGFNWGWAGPGLSVCPSGLSVNLGWVPAGVRVHPVWVQWVVCHAWAVCLGLPRSGLLSGLSAGVAHLFPSVLGCCFGFCSLILSGLSLSVPSAAWLRLSACLFGPVCLGLSAVITGLSVWLRLGCHCLSTGLRCPICLGWVVIVIVCPSAGSSAVWVVMSGLPGLGSLSVVWVVRLSVIASLPHNLLANNNCPQLGLSVMSNQYWVCPSVSMLGWVVRLGSIAFWPVIVQ